MALAVLPAFAARIAEVGFEQEGPSKISDEQLFYNIQVRSGAEYSPENVDADVKRLYGTGNFSDVVSEVIRNADGTVNLRFKLKQKPQVRKISIEGNVKFKTSELEKLLTIGADAPLNDAKLQASIKALRDFYRGKGYNDATVTVGTEPIGQYALNVHFIINENLRFKVDHVKFENATVFSQYQLKQTIANQYSVVAALPWIGNLFNTGLLHRNELELDEARLRDLYHRKGYLDFKVEKIEIVPTADDPEWVGITFILYEGEPYTLTKVEVAGNSILSAGELAPLISLRPDAAYDGGRENATRQAIQNYYESLGYADVNVRPVLHSDYQNHTTEVTFEITEGRKYTIRDVTITGNIYTKDKVIRRELVVHPGDPLDRNRIEVSKQRLMGMNYFNKVEATSVNADALDEKDVVFNIEESDKRFEFKVGAGFSDVNSLAGMIELSSNNFDLFNPGDFFYGGGQRFRAQGLFGIERAAFNIDFTEPWLFDLPLRFDLSFYGTDYEYDDWSEFRIGVRASLSRKIFDDFTTATVAYKFENVNVYDMANHLKRQPWFDKQRGHQWVSQPSIMFDRDTRNSFTNPTSGYNINLLAAVSPRILGSSNNFYRLEGKGSYYHSFWDEAIVVMAGFQIGVVSDFNRQDSVPLFERYFLGGGDSLRGFPYREVSPTTGSRHDAYGGESMMLGTLEISHPIWGFIRGAAFVDVGNAWAYSYNFQLNELNVGVGYGLRIQVPMLNVPLKLDLAYPVVKSVKGVDSKLRFHFNMGFTW